LYNVRNMWLETEFGIESNTQDCKGLYSAQVDCRKCTLDFVYSSQQEMQYSFGCL